MDHGSGQAQPHFQLPSPRIMTMTTTVSMIWLELWCLGFVSGVRGDGLELPRFRHP